jgi:hypothetical protein
MLFLKKFGPKLLIGNAFIVYELSLRGLNFDLCTLEIESGLQETCINFFITLKALKTQPLSRGAGITLCLAILTFKFQFRIVYLACAFTKCIMLTRNLIYITEFLATLCVNGFYQEGAFCH